MEDVRRELKRLARAYGRSRARARVRRAHLLLLGAAVVLAWASRALVPLPVLQDLAGRWVPALLAAAALLLLGPLARRVVVPFAVPSARSFARRLDDEMGWRDDAGTAVAVAAAGPRGAVEHFLVAQSAGRLREIEPAAAWPVRKEGWRLPAALALLFLFVLLAPGLSGLFRGRGAGRGSESGFGARPSGEDEGFDEEDADRWLREHARLVPSLPQPERSPTRVEARLTTDAPLPAAFGAGLEVVFDDESFGTDLGVDEPQGSQPARSLDLRLDSIEALRPRLVPGEHRLRVRLLPRKGPWRAALESGEIFLRIDPGGGGPSGRPPPRPEPKPKPEPEAPPASAPEPEPGASEKPPPPPTREEVITPLVNPGATVPKESAVVAVRDPKAATTPPEPVPLPEALRDFDRVVESAVSPERIRPRDREFLRRYFRALREAAGAPR